ncbi:Proteasome regulatory subunit C-terminal [Rhizoctonia solani]|uniref:Proteasome regulatory subunit C-terminal n=1 Tax=Rhizoctonia solani TaxID=456999 RepID=A0A8H7ILM2_9AGAM|nr:Proteasome regulatory subunit C-terminal [Rhizoctonia solani]
MADTKPKDTPAEPEKPIEPAPVPISVGAEIKANLPFLTALSPLSSLASPSAPARKALAPYVPSASSAKSDAIQLRIGYTKQRVTSHQFPPLGRSAHASLRRDEECQAALINLLLRNTSTTTFILKPTNSCQRQPSHLPGNSQLARYLYYVGRIRAVQLSYTEAHTHLQQAIRRAPVATLAPGFYQTVHKFFIVVELLMGDIPERGLFRHPVLKRALQPYLEIVRAVRTGDLSQFQSTLSSYKDQFTNDGTFTLILRLRHNVIKTGIRSLSIAYSRISLRTIAQKLSLDSEENAEYIHEKGWMESWERGTDRGTGRGGVYETGEPREAFQKRIAFCMELHNESNAIPLNAHRKELASAEAAREREKELAKEIQEGDMDDDGDDATMGDF